MCTNKGLWLCLFQFLDITWHHNRLLFSHCENNTLDWCFHIMKITAFTFSGKKSRYFTTENVIERFSVGQAIWTCFFLRSTFGTKGFPKKNLKVRFVYLFVWKRGWGSSHSKIFHSFGDFTIVGERLQKFHLCSAVMAIEQWVSLTCRTYCDTGQPFIMVIIEDRWRSHLLGRGAGTACSNDLVCHDRGSNPESRMRGERSTTNPLRRFEGWNDLE